MRAADSYFADMFEVDELRPYDRLGREKIEELSRTFYGLVYADTEPSFRGMFPRDKEMAIQNQYEFLIQRFGGPPVYSERKGHPALRARHARFSITVDHAAKWLEYMRQAMETVGIPDDLREAMYEYFENSAAFMVNTDEDGSRIY